MIRLQPDELLSGGKLRLSRLIFKGASAAGCHIDKIANSIGRPGIAGDPLDQLRCFYCFVAGRLLRCTAPIHSRRSYKLRHASPRSHDIRDHHGAPEIGTAPQPCGENGISKRLAETPVPKDRARFARQYKFDGGRGSSSHSRSSTKQVRQGRDLMSHHCLSEEPVGKEGGQLSRSCQPLTFQCRLDRMPCQQAQRWHIPLGGHRAQITTRCGYLRLEVYAFGFELPSIRQMWLARLQAPGA